MVDFPANHNSKRELDLLMACGETISSIVLSNELQKNHIRSTALTGAQAGFITNADFNKAKIKEVRPERLMKEFETHDVVVVAGFQGQTETGEITTIRSEEHTSELQSRGHLVCRLLLEKKKKKQNS